MEAHGDQLPKAIKKILKRNCSLGYNETSGKVTCSLTGHEMPCRDDVIKTYLAGKKFRIAQDRDDAQFEKYKPHVVPSTKKGFSHALFCVLTMRHITRSVTDVERYVNGKKYKRSLARWEECQRNGTVFKPNRRQKPVEEKPEKSKGSKSMEEEEDEGEQSDADSLSDLYPVEKLHADDESSDDDGEEVDEEEEEDTAAEEQPAPHTHSGQDKRKFQGHDTKQLKKWKQKKKQKIG